MAQKSLHELKMQERIGKNGNIITDMDYFLRDKEEEAKNGKSSVNTLDLTPVTTVSKTVKQPSVKE